MKGATFTPAPPVLLAAMEGHFYTAAYTNEPLSHEEPLERSRIDFERLSMDEMVQLRDLMEKALVETG